MSKCHMSLSPFIGERMVCVRAKKRHQNMCTVLLKIENYRPTTIFLLQCIFPDHFYANNQIYVITSCANLKLLYFCNWILLLCFFKISDHYEMCQYLAFRPCFIFCTLDSWCDILLLQNNEFWKPKMIIKFFF